MLSWHSIMCVSDETTTASSMLSTGAGAAGAAISGGGCDAGAAGTAAAMRQLSHLLSAESVGDLDRDLCSRRVSAGCIDGICA